MAILLDKNAIKDVEAYLNREPCLDCFFDVEGVLYHCNKCIVLFNKAKELLAKVPLSVDDISRLKKTHEWVAYRGIDRLGTMQPYTSHCIKCGVTIFTFKMKPERCPKEHYKLRK